MRPILLIFYLIIISIIFVIYLLKTTDLKFKLSDFLLKKIDDLENEINKIDDEIKSIDKETQEAEYIKLKMKMRAIVRKGKIAEVSISFSDKENQYRIYGFAHYVVFARANEEIFFDKSDYKYKTLDELYTSENIDSICLERDWGKITDCRIRAMKIVRLDN